MGFRTDAYATIWEIQNKGKYSVVSMSTSKKNKDTNQYETDFSSKFVRFIGRANDAITGLQKKDRVKLKNIDVTTSSVNGTWYTNYLVFDCEVVSKGGVAVENNNSADDMQIGMDMNFLNVPDDITENLPFN